MRVGSRGLASFNNVFPVVRGFSEVLSYAVSSALNLHDGICNCRCDRVVHSLVYMCFYKKSYIRSIASRLVRTLYLRPPLHAYDTSAVLETVHRLAAPGLACESSSNGDCSFGITSSLGGLLIGTLLTAKRLLPSGRCSFSFSRRFVRARGFSTGVACGGFANCDPKVTAINSIVIKVRGHSNGAGIHFRRRSALGHVFRHLRGTEVRVGHTEVSYNSYSRTVIRVIRGRDQRFCVHTGEYMSLCSSVFTLHK